MAGQIALALPDSVPSSPADRVRRPGPLGGRVSAARSGMVTLSAPGSTGRSALDGGPPGCHCRVMVAAPSPPLTAPVLPYGPVLSRLLRPIQRAFLPVNGALVAPALRHGLGIALGTPVTGHLMLLRTTGRTSGRRREVPLGYVIRDGSIWCVAGYGSRTPWYRNLVADPRVEVVLPRRLPISGLALPVTDDREWLVAYRALITSFGAIGRLVVGDVGRISDAQLLARHRSLPVVRIVPRDGRIEADRWDQGWSGAAVQMLLVLVVSTLLVLRRRLLARH
jgi:deazaflavin-dependent oxidoreductase (nitroreductase family)